MTERTLADYLRDENDRMARVMDGWYAKRLRAHWKLMAGLWLVGREIATVAFYSRHFFTEDLPVPVAKDKDGVNIAMTYQGRGVK